MTPLTQWTEPSAYMAMPAARAGRASHGAPAGLRHTATITIACILIADFAIAYFVVRLVMGWL
jgi:hypothetical protein